MVVEPLSPTSHHQPTRTNAFTHGYAAYSAGRCRCNEICRPAAAKYRREQRSLRLVQLRSDPNSDLHGSRASYDCGCRCAPCSEARWAHGLMTGEYKTGERRIARGA